VEFCPIIVKVIHLNNFENGVIKIMDNINKPLTALYKILFVSTNTCIDTRYSDTQYSDISLLVVK